MLDLDGVSQAAIFLPETVPTAAGIIRGRGDPSIIIEEGIIAS